jgi:hypothetical protein
MDPAIVTVTTDHLSNPRAFKHVDHPLEPYVGHLDEAERWTVRDAVWRWVVATWLVPRLCVPVQLAEGSYNSAWARYVNGLTENADAIEWTSVEVPSQVICEAIDRASAGDALDVEYASVAVTAPEPGISGVVGRYVECSVGNDATSLQGRVLWVEDGWLALRTDEEIMYVPERAVTYLRTSQFRPDETEYTAH